MTRMIRHTCSLLLGLGGLICFLAILNLLSDKVALIDSSRGKGLEVDAYFYSEVGDLREFLDDAKGKYGKKSLGR